MTSSRNKQKTLTGLATYTAGTEWDLKWNTTSNHGRDSKLTSSRNEQNVAIEKIPLDAAW
jgi:hypothetical protein